jgi:hypothetical protein
MNYLKSLILVFLLLFGCRFAHAQCNHRHGFSQSPASDSIDAVHYRIHIKHINFALKRILATAQITLRPKVALSQIPLELKALTVDSVSVNNEVAVFAQHGDILRIQTSQVYQPTDTLVVKVHYGGVPFHEQWGGFHFSGNYAFNLGVGFTSDPHNLGKAWFPCVDDFQDRATYEVLITLPEIMTGIAGGLLVDTIHHANNQITWHWKLDQPIPTYLASVAAGNYALTQDTYQGINATLPITIYTRPFDTIKVVGSFLNLQQILHNFENRYGPYPFDRIGYTGTAIGAMEHVTNIAYPHSAINGNLNSEYLLAHELSHMWFGNLVTCADAGDMWLNEGWATFCHHFFKNDLYGPSVYREAMNQTHYTVLRSAHIADGSYLSLHNVPTQFTYGPTVYDKGATVVHTLMNYMGEESFFEAVKAYIQHFAFSTASSYDLRDFLSNHSGIDLTDFFDAWVFTPGTPHFSIDSMNVIPEGNQFRAHVYLKQKYKGYDFLANRNILEVTFVGENWQMQTDTVHFNGKNGYSTKVLDFEPLLALPDFNDKISDARNDANGIIRNTGQIAHPTLNVTLFVDALSDSAFYRVTHHWAAPDSLKNEIPGLRISPYRHWELQLIQSGNINLRGRFFYSNSAVLDATLIQSMNDSVVMLYRPNTASDWEAISQERTGSWNMGNIIVHNLLPGQYTLAVWDKQLVGKAENTIVAEIKKLKAEPNPARDFVNLSWEKNLSGILTIVDSTGKTVMQKNIQHEKRLSIQTEKWPKGMYFAELVKLDGESAGFVRIIIQ